MASTALSVSVTRSAATTYQPDHMRKHQMRLVAQSALRTLYSGGVQFFFVSEPSVCGVADMIILPAWWATLTKRSCISVRLISDMLSVVFLWLRGNW